MIATLSVPLQQGAVVLIPAVLGAIGGLYSFFHGFSILQQQRPLPVSLPAKSTAHASKPVEVPNSSDTAKRESRTEVIQLTPENASTSSVLMTQQGKIAAALLRAGIPSPATWTDRKSSVRVAEAPTEESPLPSFEAKISVVLEPGTTTFPTPESRRAQESAKRKAMVLIWGGPILTLACVYFLAAHLGWL